MVRYEDIRIDADLDDGSEPAGSIEALIASCGRRLFTDGCDSRIGLIVIGEGATDRWVLDGTTSEIRCTVHRLDTTDLDATLVISARNARALLSGHTSPFTMLRDGGFRFTGDHRHLMSALTTLAGIDPVPAPCEG